jgi:simple sugar transport system ATP-binding protein
MRLDAPHDDSAVTRPDARIPLLDVTDVTKSFGSIAALRGARFTVHEGEVVALVGDNGAGKSTLVKMISGVLQPDTGEIRFAGEPVTLASPIDARRLGIETVYQDLSLAPDLDCAANVFLGRERVRPGLLGRLGVLDKSGMRRATQEAFTSLGTGIQNPLVAVEGLSGGQRQAVAVSRSVIWASRVVLLDEPTAALGVVQTAKVADLVRRVRDAGVAVVLISHNLPFVFEVADRIEVLRLGQRVAQLDVNSSSMIEVLGAMTGATLSEKEPTP